MNGSFAEYALADADYVGRLPDGVGFVETAPVLCAGVTVYKGLKVTDTRPGNWVVISGIGGLGHMAVQYARAMGNCYAETFDERWRGIMGHTYEQGFDLKLVPERLEEPLRWKTVMRTAILDRSPSGSSLAGRLTAAGFEVDRMLAVTGRRPDVVSTEAVGSSDLGARARSRLLVIALAIGLLALPGAPALGQDRPDPSDKHMFRFEFDNDTFQSSDDAFSAGWSLQLHSPLHDTWDETLPKWIGAVPGLGDDGEGGRIVRWGVGLTQMIITPDDVSVAEPQPEDSPWAGILGVYGSLSSYDNRRLAAVQLFLGCMGPCSQAEDVQTFIHEDLGRGTPPEGWSNQLDTEMLVNLNLAGDYKLWAPPESSYAPGRWATDVAVGGQVGVGNFATFARAQVELRFGVAMPQGFTHIPDTPGVGIALDPVYPWSDPESNRRWRGYASVVVRANYFSYLAPAEGGDTENGGYHPGVDISHGQPELLIGLHTGRAPVSLHLTYYRYLSGTYQIGQETSLDWVNISLEIRF